MPIDASAVARVLGIETKYEDLRAGGVLYMPQRIAVLAQGSSDAVYSTAKFTAQSAAHVGGKVGYGSPAHLIALQLLPPNGDGVGLIPVDFYPLAQAGGSTAAVGTITPSGTQTKAATYVAKIGNVRSLPFTIPVGASVSHILGQIQNALQSVLEMPVNVALTYGVVTSTPGTNTGNGTVTTLSITGAPRSGAYKLTLITAVADGGVFRLTDPDGNVISNAITMTPGAGGTTVINVAGIQFTITDGATNFVVGDSFTITVPATVATLTTKWKGASANAAKIVIEGDAYGVTFAIVQPTGGAGNPTLTAALTQFGNVWESLVLNALNISDTAALDEIQTIGEGRWGALTRKPFVCFTGNTAADVADATAVSSLRRTDRINAQLVSPGSYDLPFVVAARQLARIAALANNNPPCDYGSLRATGLTPGDDSVQWNALQRDQAVKLGSSTIEVKDGVVNVSDVVTFYRPTGEEPPGYRHVCDIVKLQNILFNLALRFENEKYDGAPMIPDSQPTVNPRAKKPRMIIAEANALVDNLGLHAIISDPAGTKKKTTCAIDSMNPKRWNLKLKPALSGNSNVKDVELAFGFYFGTSALVG